MYQALTCTYPAYMVEINGLSFSTFAAFLRCAKALDLEKYRQVPQVPAVYFAGGTSVHAVTERWERLYEAQREGKK